MGWGEFEKKAKEASGGGGGMYVKIKPGESISGIFRGDPYVFYKVFGEKVEYPTRVPGSSFRFKINFVMRAGDSYEAMILVNGAFMANAIMACKEEYGLDCVYKIKRTGQGKDTKYQLLFQSKLSEKQLSEIEEKVALNSFTEKGDQDVYAGGAYDPSVPAPTDDDLPF